MKEKIVVLHGWESKIERWKPLKKELEKAGFEVFLPQLPGFGKSKPPKEPWGVSDYLQWVKERLPERYFLLGYSFGGRIAIKLASQNPEGLTGLILVNSAGVSRASFSKRFLFFLLAKAGKIFFSLPPFCLCQPWAKRLLYLLARERDYYQAKGVMRKTLQKVISEDLKGELRKIKVATLILWGEKDRMTPLNDGRVMNDLISHSVLEIFSGAGHNLPLKLPKKVANPIIEFCRKNQ